MLTPTEVEQFLEIFSARQLTNAALKLRVTQPTLTQSLQKMEEKMGASLFVRSRQGLIPTESGKLLFDRARALQEDWLNLRAEAEKIRYSLLGRFRIGAHPAVASYCLPDLLRNLGASDGRIDLELFHDRSAAVLERLVAHELDIAFVVNPIRHPDLVYRKLAVDEVTFFRLSGKQSVPQLLIYDAKLQQIQSLLKRAKEFEQWQTLNSSSLELIRSLVMDGLGVGLLPTRIALVNDSKLVPYRRGLPIVHDEIFLAYRPTLRESASGRLLIDVASKILRSDG